MDIWGPGISTRLWLPLFYDEQQQILLLVLITPWKSHDPSRHKRDYGDLLLAVIAKVQSDRAIIYLTHLTHVATTESSSSEEAYSEGQ